ncbi:oligosaccharide flippase family protein [Echinicola sp. CAU 1574]|uniref:Oligosaccharide flippase family protein n=1 Tax=Echinicola arenosa TaxID=2774144 RepID=A0ABR9AMY0_9BACT|nr:oligosaccharide flippase family protein [Echinicola arenosa]MBD8490060.1 oligosaccharide flippase family protein [Echinicola arenosa]
MKGGNNIKEAFWAGLGTFSSFSFGIISAALLSRYLDKPAYGTYKQIVYIYSMLLIVFSAGLPRVYPYFLPRYQKAEGKSIVMKVTLLLSSIGLVFSAFIYVGADLFASWLQNEALAASLRLFSPIPFLLLPTLGIEGILSSYQLNKYIALYTTITRFVTLFLIVCSVMVFGATVENALYGWLVGAVFTCLWAFYFKRIPFLDIEQAKTGLKYKEILGYSLPIVLSSIWAMGIKAADQFYISRYFGQEVFAEYSNGFVDIPFVPMITSSVSLVVLPLFSKIFHEKSRPEVQLLPIWKSAIYKSAMLIYPLVVFCFCHATEIMVFVFTNAYSNSGLYFMISIISNLFNIVVFAPLFFAAGKTSLYAIVHFFMAMGVWSTGYVVTVVFDNPYGVALNSVFWNALKITVFIHLAARLLQVRVIDFIPFVGIVKVILLSVSAIIVSMFMAHYLYTGADVFLQLLLSSGLYFMLIYVLGKLLKIDYAMILKGVFTNKAVHS